MALNFPNSPVDGQIYYDPTSGAKYVWVAASSKWKSMQYSSTVVAFGYQTANAAYDTSNAAFDMANAAFSIQNVDFTLSNSAFAHANASYDSANSNWAVQNALYSVANSAFDAANNVGPQIAPTYNTANAAFAVANAALPNVSNAVFAGNLRVTGNLLIGMNTVTIRDNHIISAEYYRMNTANHMVAIPDGNRVNTIFSLVNVSFDTANASYNSANNVGPQIAPTYNTANAAYNHANAAHTIANDAYAHANTKFSSSGGSISGAVEINADLTVRGNTRFIDQQTLAVGDPLIYLAANNYTSDIVDIGFVANYVNTTSVNVHTGLFRSSATKEYYLFQGYDKEPINNYIDPTGNNISMAVLNSSVRTSNLILGGANAINWITSLYNSSNADYVVSNTAYASVNSNWTVTNTVYGVANAAFGVANTVTNYLPLSGGTMSGALNIGTSTNLSFGSATRQMVNLWSTSYGIGVQRATQYFRTGTRFSWHRGVVHSDSENDPGSGGTLAMTLDGSSHLTAYGSMRSPLFYDSDNTGYYYDGAGTTNINILTAVTLNNGTNFSGRPYATASQSVGTLQNSTGSLGGFEIQGGGGTNAAFMSFHRPGAWASYFGVDNDNQFAVGGWSAGADLAYFKCKGIGVGTAASASSGRIYASGELYSTIFYDYNNTGYYTDPASTSVLNGVTAYGVIDNSPQTGYLRLPIGTTGQRPSPSTGMLRYNSSYNNLEMYNGSYWFNIGTSSSDPSAYDGSSSTLAALSPWDIKMLTGTNTDGVYWINLPTVGATQVYCLMDEKWAGGGWMMAMKATRGTTFNYGSTYWTAINTLNPTDNTRNDADAKYNSFNYYKGKDLLALWPDIGQGGMLQNTGCWSWVQNNFMSGAPTTLYNLFSTGNQVNLGSGRAFGGYGHGVFSSQGGWQWYGFNYQGNTNMRVRWGFAWNNETDQSSNDVSGGIGMTPNSYSAGDYISAAQDITGMNRSARVEMYIR